MITGSRSISPEIPILGSMDVTGKIDKKPAKGKARVITYTLPKPSGPIKLTTKLTVDYMLTITSLPSTWTVPQDNSATLLDLSAWESLPRKSNGDEYSIDALIRAEVCVNSSPHCKINPFLLPRIKTPGEVQLVALLGRFMSLDLMRMTPQRVSTAVVPTFTATAFMYANTLTRIFSKGVSVMNPMITRCESSGIVSLTLMLAKRWKK
jgi:hypothetical protein